MNCDPELDYEAMSSLLVAVIGEKHPELLAGAWESIFPNESSALTRAICDKSLPRPLRAGMLREINNAGKGLGIVNKPFGLTFFAGAEIPLAFWDSHLGREWFCRERKPGYEDVRGSDLFFFEKSLSIYREYRLEQATLKIDPKVKDAIESDSPAKLRILLDLEGKTLGVRLLNIILLHRKPNMLWFLMENDKLSGTFLDHRRILFYACANLDADDALGLVEKAEKLQPGIAATCVDALGRNLLWYTLYSGNDCDNNLSDALIGFGCDPDAETAWNLSWRDMKEDEG